MSTGLRRFAVPAPPPPEQEQVERCEMCAEPIGAEHGPGSGHGHVVDLETRALMCTCRACYLLFAPIALRCQIRIEPQRRNHNDREAEQLMELFGERSRWGDTLKPFQFANTSTVVAGFTGSTEVEFTVPCTYDLEVVTGRYFHALDDGEIPFTLLFSGTVFGKGEQGLWVEQVPWHLEASHRTPVSVWYEMMMMEHFFPGGGWLRLRHDTIDELTKYKGGRALPTWDDTLVSLLDEAKERQP